MVLFTTIEKTKHDGNARLAKFILFKKDISIFFFIREGSPDSDLLAHARAVRMFRMKKLFLNSSSSFPRCCEILFKRFQEVAQFQNRLNRNMQECQEKARDMLTPGTENDSYAMSKVEKVLISCMESQVKEHIKLLKPMKERCVSIVVL